MKKQIEELIRQGGECNGLECDRCPDEIQEACTKSNFAGYDERHISEIVLEIAKKIKGEDNE